MKRKSFLIINFFYTIIFLFLTNNLKAEYLEKTIWLPDDFGGVYYPSVTVFNPNNNKIYVAGSNNRICIINGTTHQRCGAVNVGKGTHFLSYNSISNKIYCSNSESNTIQTISGDTDSIIATISVGNYPRGLQYNYVSNKLYCANYDDNTVTIIDGQNEQIIKTLDGFSYPERMCFNPLNNKVYCENFGSESISVISGLRDSIVEIIDLTAFGGSPQCMIYDSVHNQIYSGNYYGTIAVISGDSNKVIDTIGAAALDMTINYQNSRLYAISRLSSSSKQIKIISTETNTLIDSILLSYTPSSIIYDPVNDKIFCASDNYGRGTLYTIDASNDSIISENFLDRGLGPILYLESKNELYIPDQVYDLVSIFDCENDSLIKFTRVGANPLELSYNSIDNYIYCAASDTNIYAISCSLNLIVDTIKIPRYPRILCYNSNENKLYCACDWRTLTIIDCYSNTILDTLIFVNSFKELKFNPIDNKLYCFVDMPDTGTVFIIDGQGDSILAVDSISSDLTEATHNTINDKIYCGSHMANVPIIDGKGDSLIRTVKVASYGTYHLTYNSSNNKVYCSTMEYVIRVLDGFSDSVISTIDAGSSCWSLCYNSTDNKIYEGEGYGRIYIIDGSTDSILKSIDLSDGPRDLIYSEKYNKIYGSHPYDNYVSVISGSEDSLISTIEVGQSPGNLANSPKSDRLYCVNHNNSSISVIKCVKQGGVKEKILPKYLYLNIYPNLTTDQIKIEYFVPQKSKISLKIYDVTGRMIRVLIDGEIEKGRHTNVFNLEELSNGIYFVVLQNEDYHNFQKLIITK
jgi:YVTN family beta-propeller protein